MTYSAKLEFYLINTLCGYSVLIVSTQCLWNNVRAAPVACAPDLDKEVFYQCFFSRQGHLTIARIPHCTKNTSINIFSTVPYTHGSGIECLAPTLVAAHGLGAETQDTRQRLSQI
jgi:hypothetical protein